MLHPPFYLVMRRKGVVTRKADYHHRSRQIRGCQHRSETRLPGSKRKSLFITGQRGELLLAVFPAEQREGEGETGTPVPPSPGYCWSTSEGAPQAGRFEQERG